MNTPMTIRERFGLRRDNFILDPVNDTECFARDDVDTHEIAESLDIDLLTGIPPKRLVWGEYGGGKTHTLMRAIRELEHLTPIYACRIECPDLSKRSRFHDLYREGIMRELGQDFVIGLIQDAVDSVGTARRGEIMDGLKKKFDDEQVAKAAIRLIDPNFDQLRLWRWISGVPLARSDLDDLGQTEDLTQAEAARLADYLCLIGRLLLESRKQTLVLVLDEMERLSNVGPETVTTFVSGFTRLVDQNQRMVSVLIGASAAVLSELPEVFSPPVLSRLGSDALIEIKPLEDAGVDKFIKGVIKYVREPAVSLQKLIEKVKDDNGETIDQNFFPFTVEAVDALKSVLTRSMTPRDIANKMTRSLGRAQRAGRFVITSELVN